MITAETVKRIARECGFDLAGIAAADPPADFSRYESWVAAGMAGAMGYLADRRAGLRRDVRNLLPGARSVICVGKLYNQPRPRGGAIVSRYAAGPDYHDSMRGWLERMVGKLRAVSNFDWKICVDTAPILERTFARLAGLGWIGKNTCLINEPLGSWFFLGEILTTLELAPDSPPPDRCGTCTRCIDSCPTQAIVADQGHWRIDARSCIAYFTIELRGPIPEPYRSAMGGHVFGCDVCQDVCPWNARAPETDAFPRMQPAFELEKLAHLSEAEFALMFRGSAIARPKYVGLLRNVAVAMGNSGLPRYREPLQHLTRHEDATVREHAEWALQALNRCAG